MTTGKATPINQQGIDDAVGRLGVNAPALWAVLTVETSGCGFLPDRRPKILFERHWFSRLTHGQFDSVDPGVSYPKAGGYGPAGAFQHERLANAISLDRKAALQSASWGLGQVMGFNAEKVGFNKVEELVTASQDSENAQIAAMVEFIVQANIGQHLRNGDWAEFARRYNGVDFQKNRYDEKLALNHKRFLQGPMPDLVTRTVQMALMLLGYGGVNFVDGWFGKNTQKALIRFQTSEHLAVTGAINAESMAALNRKVGW